MNTSDSGPSFYALGYIVLTVVIGKWADSRGRGALAWTLISASITPPIAALILLALPIKN